MPKAVIIEDATGRFRRTLTYPVDLPPPLEADEAFVPAPSAQESPPEPPDDVSIWNGTAWEFSQPLQDAKELTQRKQNRESLQGALGILTFEVVNLLLTNGTISKADLSAEARAAFDRVRDAP